MTRLFYVLFVGAMIVFGTAKSSFADEFPPKNAGGQSGMALSRFCTHVPDLSVNRPDSVDTWVKICTVYFNARTNLPGLRPGGRGGPKGGPGSGRPQPPQR